MQKKEENNRNVIYLISGIQMGKIPVRETCKYYKLRLGFVLFFYIKCNNFI